MPDLIWYCVSSASTYTTFVHSYSNFYPASMPVRPSEPSHRRRLSQLRLVPWQTIPSFSPLRYYDREQHLRQSYGGIRHQLLQCCSPPIFSQSCHDIQRSSVVWPYPRTPPTTPALLISRVGPFFFRWRVCGVLGY